ncbi:hypothetical protein OIV83_002389 [Microbotryomycetes sp. JL201]|nr:hypothetical protein OIV83_002389 [Microbotryomycetes sp. JL201]
MAAITPANSSYRLFSLAAVCIQSTALAIILHVSQASGGRSYKASSAVLLTELGKLVLSVLLALRDASKERAALHKPRHTLPSPELYAMGDEILRKDLYSDDPYNSAPPTIEIDRAPEPTSASHARGLSRNQLRRRSSAQAHMDTLNVTLDVINNKLAPRKFPEYSSLHAFQWPRPQLSPIISEKCTPENSPNLEVVQRLSDPELWIRRRRLGLPAMLWEDVFGSDWYKMAVPAVLFAVQNNLIYLAAKNLSVPVFQISFQLKTLITALCAVVMLGRKLTVTQWLSLVILGAGVATMQLGAIHAKANDSHHHAETALQQETMNYVTGVGAVLVSCLSSAIAATYFELVIKRRPQIPDVPELTMVAPPDIKPVSLWVRNIQLSMFSTILGVGLVLFQASEGHLMGEGGLSLDFKGMVDPLEHWYDPVLTAAHGFFEGFNNWTWVVITLQTVGGLLIALVIKYADNVAKGFALSVSIVFTFLLSIILFEFKPTFSSVVGASAVIGATMLYEADDKTLRQLVRPEPYGPGKPLLRKWHYFLLVIFGTTLYCAIFPSNHYSVTSAALDLYAGSAGSHSKAAQTVWKQPTIAIADMKPVTDLLRKGAGAGHCQWGLQFARTTTQEPFGTQHPVSSDYPYHVFNTDQYALDNLLSARIVDYARLVPILANPSPDFIFLPVWGQALANSWHCEDPVLREGIQHTISYIRQIVASVGKSPYPRIILPLATIRSNFEHNLLTRKLMEEFKDSVIVVSIESAPKSQPEGLKYLIDVPYPTSFHLSRFVDEDKPDVGDYWLSQNRPFLLHYAASATHPWGTAMSDPFNGFAVRAALRKEFVAYESLADGQKTSQILFDDIVDPMDGGQNLTMFHQHMGESVFCLMPAGDSPTRRAFYEAALLGCIPVTFRERSYGRLLPSSPELNDLSKYTFFIDENEIINGIGPTVIERLEAIPLREVHRMQRHLRSIASKLQWSVPAENEWFPLRDNTPLIQAGLPIYNHSKSVKEQLETEQVVDAFQMLIKELDTIRRGEWRAGLARDTRKGMSAQRFGRVHQS